MSQQKEINQTEESEIEFLRRKNQQYAEALESLEASFKRLLHSNLRIKQSLDPITSSMTAKPGNKKPSFLSIMANPKLLASINEVVPVIVKEVTDHVGPIVNTYLPFYPLPTQEKDE